MIATHNSLCSRSLAALLALAFFVASLPAPALAQDVPPPTAEPPADDASVAPVAPAPSPQDRIRQLRLSRPARTAPAAMPTATDEPAPMPAFDALDAAAGADSEAVYQLNFKDSPLDLLLDRYS